MLHNFLRRTGFRTQLTAVVSAAILILALFSALMNSWEANRRMKGYLVEQGQHIAENLARQSTLALLYHSPDNAWEGVATTLAFPDVLLVEITDASHKILLSQAKPGATIRAKQQRAPAIALTRPVLELETEDEWRFGAPVYTGQADGSPFELQERQPQLLGHVHVVIGKGTVNRLVNSLLIGNLIITLSFAIILLGIVRLLSKRMIRPLNALSELMGRAEAGESGMRAQPEGPLDIIKMALAFNEMMVVLEQREKALRQSRDEALHTALMKAQFAATVSHEVRTPLNGVVGMLDMLKEMHLTPTQQECVEVARRSSHALMELINDILDFSKMEAGKLELEEIEFDLRQLVEDVFELLVKQARQKELKLSYLLADNVPDRIVGDARRLRQVLINLVGNAVKFTEQGEVAIHISCAADGDAAGCSGLRFEVSDTGIGMTPDAASHVFESFAQADRSTTSKYGGTGLGLAICKQLVGLMRGAIGVNSEPGQGSTFWFTIACKPATANIGIPADQNLQGIRSVLPSEKHNWTGQVPLAQHTAATGNTKEYLVLVAEDNPTNQMVAAGMLAMNGCRCEFAANGREAVEAFRNGHFDLILMDCSMPEMDGYQATAHIRNIEESLGRHTPIIAMTANTQQGDADKCLAAGMDDYLAKPVTLDGLRRKLTRWLTRSVPVEHVIHQSQRESRLQPAEAVALDQNVFNKLRDILGPALQRSVALFLEDTPTYLAQLEQSINLDDAEAARAMAHSIKGSSGNLGAVQLAQYAKEIEEMARNLQLADMRLLLPQLRQAYDTVAAKLEPELHIADRAGISEERSLPKVLVVDDDRSTRNTLRHALQREGFEVEEASDGAEALLLLKRMQPDVILMDALMPVMDGFTACTRLQELPHGRTIPVMMISALEDNHSVERAFAAGASDYIAKSGHLTALPQRVRNILEANQAEKRIRHLAYNDPLTGLSNRALFIEQLGLRIEQARQNKLGLAVLFLDLDRFKYVNDSLGHEIGDHLLVAVAQRIRHSVRNADCVARLGGDEFTVVLTNTASPSADAAAAAAQNISQALATPFKIEGNDIFIGTSIGISLYPIDGEDVGTLLRHADTAMYRAKKTNTGIQFFEPSMFHYNMERLRMENDLRGALARQEMNVLYQPQALFGSGEIVCVEALMHWNHPTRGMVPPVEFIPLAEETGLINSLGEWILRTACSQMQSWIAAGLPRLRLAVNISVKQLLQKEFPAMVEQALNDTGLSPEFLELEITESTLMEHAQDTLQILHQLRNLGVRLTIDDFGTGYSSLSYLKRFPVEIIKIDQSFVRDLPDDADDAAIVTGIIALAHSLRLEVVAEGVETEAQLRFLRDKSCDILQGYHLSKPLPAEQCGRFLEAQAQVRRNDSAGLTAP